jgi:hypothetical protein
MHSIGKHDERNMTGVLFYVKNKVQLDSCQLWNSLTSPAKKIIMQVQK